MDDHSLINLKMTIDLEEYSCEFDFRGSSDQSELNINTPYSVVKSAIIYSLRALCEFDIPLNHGCMLPISILTRQGSILNPDEDRAIVGGNVLTSQRITDVILECFGTNANS